MARLIHCVYIGVSHTVTAGVLARTEDLGHCLLPFQTCITAHAWTRSLSGYESESFGNCYVLVVRFLPSKVSSQSLFRNSNVQCRVSVPDNPVVINQIIDFAPNVEIQGPFLNASHPSLHNSYSMEPPYAGETITTKMLYQQSGADMRLSPRFGKLMDSLSRQYCVQSSSMLTSIQGR